MEPEENRTGRRWNLPLILLLILAATALFSAGTGRRTGSGIANTESKNAEQAANVGNEADDSSLRSDAEAVNSYGDIYWMPPESGAGEASVPKEEVAQTVKTAEPETEKTIRVKICASDYEEALHDRIQITSSGTYSLQWSGGEEVYPGDQILTIDPEDDRLKNGKMTVAAENGLQLVNVHRECGYPVYPGSIEIWPEDGRLAVINKVDLEEYLKRVVPGEMLLSYGTEALKVQAICARNYAWNKLSGAGADPVCGANVDDSVNYQVYNNQERGEAADQAVEETRGQVLTYQGEVIDTYYFSVSCGTTTDLSIWQENPADTPYYPASALNASRESLDLSEESAFRGFIDWYQDSYDAGSDFYRWKIVLSVPEITASVSDYLEKHSMEPVGTITDLEVTKRGGGGIIEELSVTGSEGRTVLYRQSAVREALGNAEMVIALPDGRTVTNWKMLPSAFFYMEEQRDGDVLIGYILHGGGYGHGAGMSQSGAYGLIREGKTYEEALAYFYPGTELISLIY